MGEAIVQMPAGSPSITIAHYITLLDSCFEGRVGCKTGGCVFVRRKKKDEGMIVHIRVRSLFFISYKIM